MKLNPATLTVDMRYLSHGMNVVEIMIPIQGMNWNIDDVEPESSEGYLNLNLDYRSSSVVCTGFIDAVFRTPCARCLKPVLFDITEDINRTYVFGGRKELQPDTEVVSDGGEFSVLNALREAVVLSMPGKPLCSPDCRGICYN